MTLPADRIGDRGQRWEAQERGWRHAAEWRTVGWSETREGAERLCAAIALHPSCVETRVVDRHEPTGVG